MDTTQLSALPDPDAPSGATEARARARARPVIDWLLEDERLRAARTVNLFDRFARRLVAAGIPLGRSSLHIRQLHPQLAARSLVWDAEAGSAKEAGHEHSAQHEPVYLRSPIRPIFEGGGRIRRRIERPDCPNDFPVLEDLRKAGATDYIVLPLAFSGGRVNALSLATGRSGGFSKFDLAFIDEVLPAFATVLELQQLRRTARELLDTYVGPNAGERIFNGTIRRGDGEVIHAVIWYCDLRDFTELTESEPLTEVIALLNAYFDRIAEPVTQRGGEILKFIGDAMLAIFPCATSDTAVCTACDAAIDAAEAAVAGVAELNAARIAAGKAPIECGVAIHVGEAMYGNVGAADRLDFTVIGPAVNLVSRLEPLCAELGRHIVVSADLVKVSRRTFRSLGRHTLKGIAMPTEVFGLAAQASAA